MGKLNQALIFIRAAANPAIHLIELKKSEVTMQSFPSNASINIMMILSNTSAIKGKYLNAFYILQVAQQYPLW
jgi:hypothetical protein